MRNSCNLLLKKFLVDLYHHMDLADFKEALHPALRAINVEGVGCHWLGPPPRFGRRSDGRTDGRGEDAPVERTDGRKIKVCARSSQSKGKHLSGAVSFLSRDTVPGRYFDLLDVGIKF